MKRILLPASLVLLGACEPDVEIREQQRLLDSFPYVDCGALAPGSRQVCTVPLFSQERGRLKIFDIASADISYPEGGVGEGGAFIVRDEDWMNADCGDGDCRELQGYDAESDEDTLALPITFAPQVEGEYQAELTIWSNDNQTTAEEPMPDDPERSEPVWKVQLRGLSRPACGRVWPTFVDLGRRQAPGAEFSGTAQIENCGIVALVVASFPESGTGAEEMDVTSSTPLHILPGLSEEISFSWVVGNLTDGELTPVTTEFGFVSNALDTLDLETLTVIGNTCDGSVLETWDADADGWTVCGGDCDDADPTTNPSLTERAGNGRDDDCDGEIDEAANPVATDDDGDGYSENAGDCDDADAAVNPAAIEVINQIDDDCNDLIDDQTERYDDDHDGYSEREGDVDDSSRLVYPGAPESQDGVDNDGDGVIDEGGSRFDDDQDGYAEIESDVAMNDCDDGDAWTYAGAFEFCDGYDNDCDGTADEGEDDTPEGACAFLPERRNEVVTDAARTCATVPGGDFAGVAIGLMMIAAVRRRR